MEKIVLITGGNSGIGKAAAVILARKGCTVIIACRNEERGVRALADIKRESGSERVEMMLMDLSLKKSIQVGAERFGRKYKRLDVLIHNAAEFDLSRKEIRFNEENVETVWAGNYLGPVLLTKLMMDYLRASDQGRIIAISSKGLLAKPFLNINFADPEFRMSRFSMERNYYHSKLALMIWSMRLAEQLSTTPMTVNAIRVPAVKVDLSRLGSIPKFLSAIYALKTKRALMPEQMAETYCFLALDPQLTNVSGKYFSEKNTVVKQPKKFSDRNTADRLLVLTQEYLESS